MRGAVEYRGLPWPSLLLLPVFLQGCTAGMATWVDEPLAPAFPRAADRLAVLPVAAEPGSEAVRPWVADALHRELRGAFPDLVVLGPDEVVARLGASSAASDYADLVEDYERAGVVESARVGRLTRLLDADHLLQVRVTYHHEDFLDPDPFDDGVTRENRQVMALVARLWGPDDARPAWEAVVRTTSETNFIQWKRRPVDDLVREVAVSLAEGLPVRVSRR